MERMPVKHLVVAKFKESLTFNEIDEIIQEYAALMKRHRFTWGVDLGPSIETKSQCFTHSFKTAFPSVEILSEFLRSDDSEAFAKKFFPACEKYVVLNYQRQPPPK